MIAARLETLSTIHSCTFFYLNILDSIEIMFLLLLLTLPIVKFCLKN